MTLQLKLLRFLATSGYWVLKWILIECHWDARWRAFFSRPYRRLSSSIVGKLRLRSTSSSPSFIRSVTDLAVPRAQCRVTCRGRPARNRRWSGTSSTPASPSPWAAPLRAPGQRRLGGQGGGTLVAVLSALHGSIFRVDTVQPFAPERDLQALHSCHPHQKSPINSHFWTSWHFSVL
jgi:hypothetical protein